MARTVLTATQLPNVGGVDAGAGAEPDHVNGNIVASPGPFRSLIIVSNTGSALNLLVRASGYQGTPGGAANSGYVTGQYQPFATASTGDLTVTLTADATTIVDLEQDTERFTQADGSMWLDWSAATTDLLAWVAQRPYMP
jgi:hypothetical protein